MTCTLLWGEWHWETLGVVIGSFNCAPSLQAVFVFLLDRSIPMSDAQLSLSVEGKGEEGTRTVVVSVRNGEYHLIAPTLKIAQNWYCQIQEKTKAPKQLAAQQSTESVSDVK